MSYKTNKYQVIRGVISEELADVCLRYLAISHNADAYLINKNITNENNVLIGNFKDAQVPNSYAKYADRLTESLLIQTIPLMEKETGLKLIPTYSYCRLYKKGNVLNRHKDRPSCEISTTLNLGGDEWSIYLSSSSKDNISNSPKEIKIDLKKGDMLIYKGCELEDWREVFEGNVCGQVFLHYNQADGEFDKSNLYDKRPMLGVPKLNV